MEKNERLLGVSALAALTFIILPFFWLMQGYLLFHFLAENITILIALLLFIVGTRTYRYSKNTISRASTRAWQPNSG